MTKNLNKFCCRECGSRRLGYRIDGYTVAPVIFLNKGVKIDPKYLFSDEGFDYLITAGYYECMRCRKVVEHCGQKIQTKKELIAYFRMDPKIRQKEEDEYEIWCDVQDNIEMDLRRGK